MLNGFCLPLLASYSLLLLLLASCTSPVLVWELQSLRVCPCSAVVYPHATDLSEVRPLAPSATFQECVSSCIPSNVAFHVFSLLPPLAFLLMCLLLCPRLCHHFALEFLNKAPQPS